MEKVNIKDKLSRINDQWNPRIAGELNGQHIRLVKIEGDFAFHKHEEEEMFLVINGHLKLDFKDKIIELDEGEFLIVPRGVVHRPIANEEAHLMMFVPATNKNTGDITNEATLDTTKLETI